VSDPFLDLVHDPVLWERFGRQEMLRTSGRKAFKRCVQQWKWAYLDGLEPKQQRGGALWFGTGIHLAMEKWYVPGKTRGVEPQETWEQFVGERIEHIKTLIVKGEAADGAQTYWEDALTLGDAILANYRREYGLDEKWQILSPEQTVQVMMPHPRIKGLKIVKQVATFDLVAINQETGEVWLWDHKTAASISTGHLWGDDQAGAYWAIADTVLVHKGLMKKGQVIRGILYNFILKSDMDYRPENEQGLKTNKPTKQHYVQAMLNHFGEDEPIGSELLEEKYWKKQTLAQLEDMARVQKLTVLGDVSAQQPAPRFHREEVFRTRREKKQQIKRIGDEVMWMNAVRSGQLPVIKNHTRECGFCTFREMCELDEKQGDVEEYKELMFDVRDPYAAHRPEED
jgi:hypothetical protein